MRGCPLSLISRPGFDPPKANRARGKAAGQAGDPLPGAGVAGRPGSRASASVSEAHCTVPAFCVTTRSPRTSLRQGPCATALVTRNYPRSDTEVFGSHLSRLPQRPAFVRPLRAPPVPSQRPGYEPSLRLESPPGPRARPNATEAQERRGTGRRPIPGWSGAAGRPGSGLGWPVALTGERDESVGADVVLAVEDVEFFTALFETPQVDG